MSTFNFYNVCAYIEYYSQAINSAFNLLSLLLRMNK